MSVLLGAVIKQRGRLGWFVLLGALAACRTSSIPGPDLNQPAWLPEPLQVVAESQAKAQSMAQGLKDAGFRIQTHGLPLQASSGWWWLDRQVVQQVNLESLLQKGDKILLDGVSSATQHLLGLQASGTTVKQINMLGTTVQWDTAIPGNRPSLSGKAYAQTPEGHPAFLMGEKLLWSLAPLDEGAGLLRLPYLPQALYEAGLRPLAERHEIDLYFDPDTEATVPLTVLVDRWRKAGVRRVFVSAWKFNQIQGWSYNYSRLIEEAHRQGVLVYAWVALPHVSFSFWEQYPQCKEVTASGQGAHIFWRENVALGAPRCLEAAWGEIKSLLEAHPFDGVNLAELYFESPGAGPKDPPSYTPFHPEVRKEFKAQAGFDPLELFNDASPHYWPKNAGALSSWEGYRVKLVTELHRQLLTQLYKLNKPLLVTLIDDRYPSPAIAQLARNIGISSPQIIGLRQTLPFEVQVEDPYILWNESAQRYTTIAQAYSEVPPQALSLDINVVERGNTLPQYSTTSIAQGFELYQSIANVGATGVALALYSSSTIAPADYSWIKYALAAQSSRVSEAKGILQTESPKAFLLHLNRPFARVFLDGKVWGGRTEQGVWVPAGKHSLWLEAGPPQAGTLSDTTCPDFALSGPDPRKQTFSTKTTVPCAALVSGIWKLVYP